MRRGWRTSRLAAASSTLAMLAFSVVAAFAEPPDELVAAARAEGELNVIALPRDWCGYGGIIDAFEARYGLTVNELRPTASSTEEIEAIRRARAGAGPEAPDVIDVGLAFGQAAKHEGLLQPYKVQGWDTIPDNAKDAEGYWYGDYYGTLVFEVNADVVSTLPKDWADLAAPGYRQSVALAGELSSNQAILAVLAAGLSAAGGNVEAAADRGLSFFADLARRGNILGVFGDSDTLSDGRTPILIRWDYLALGDQDRLAGKTRIEVIRPRSGTVAGIYVQAISAFAAHPNAARLWMEHLYSDEAQLAWLKAHCQPIRLADLRRNNKVPVDLRKGMTPFRHHERVEPFFPTIEQQEKAREVITKGWDGIVGITVECQRVEDPPGPMSFYDSGKPPICLRQ